MHSSACTITRLACHNHTHVETHSTLSGLVSKILQGERADPDLSHKHLEANAWGALQYLSNPLAARVK